jgi:2-polyprenyl-6-hydroxyphenyl methylase/3-demethylubiquinone-9 3-methyltransferase
MIIWKHSLDDGLLDEFARDWLGHWQNTEPPPLDTVWRLMDDVWDGCGLDNRHPLSPQQLAGYYSHPVWTLNGIYTEVDPVSVSHRQALARHISDLGLLRGADYGGGFGCLAMRIAECCQGCQIEIVEPFPSAVAQSRIRPHPRVSFVPQLNPPYDFAVAQDVLEHVDDPLGLAHEIISSVRPGGYVYFANCFYPVIHCHLPHTFHLRHTFRWVIRPLGVQFVAQVPDAPHIHAYQRLNAPPILEAARVREQGSRFLGRLLNKAESTRHVARRVLQSYYKP